MQRSSSATSLPENSSSAGAPPSIDSLFPMQMSLRHLKRTAVAAVLLQNKIPGLASPAILSVLGDVLGRLIEGMALRMSRLQMNASALLWDVALMQSVMGSGMEEEVLTGDLQRQRPFVLEQMEEFVEEVVSKPPKNGADGAGAGAFGALEATGMLPQGFRLAPSNTKIKRLAQL